MTQDEPQKFLEENDNISKKKTKLSYNPLNTILKFIHELLD